MRWAAILQATRKEKHLKSSKTEEAQEQHTEEEEAPLFADPPKLMFTLLNSNSVKGMVHKKL